MEIPEKLLTRSGNCLTIISEEESLKVSLERRFEMRQGLEESDHCLQIHEWAHVGKRLDLFHVAPVGEMIHNEWKLQ